MYAHVRVKDIFQPPSYIKMHTDLSSVHPQSLREQRAKGYFSSHNDYGKRNKTKPENPAAEEYGKVQLLTCLSHTQTLSSESTTTLAPLRTAPVRLTSGRNLPASQSSPGRLRYLRSHPSRFGPAPAPGTARPC